MKDRYLDLLQKHRELQEAFSDTLEMNRKFGTEKVCLEKENEQLQQENERLAKRICELQSNLAKAKSQIEKLEQQYGTCPYRYNDMGCYYCDYKDRDLAQ